MGRGESLGLCEQGFRQVVLANADMAVAIGLGVGKALLSRERELVNRLKRPLTCDQPELPLLDFSAAICGKRHVGRYTMAE